VGGDPSIAAPIGKSLTLLSGATDIHDDMIDRTVTKEDRHTVLGRFGGDVALVAGDVLIFKGFTDLFDSLSRLDIPLKRKLAIAHIINKLYLEMGDAEALELRFRGCVDVRPEEYLHVVRKKAADIEVCMRIGAILGGGSRKQVDALGEYGRLLGMIVLLRNDLEDMLDEGELNSRIRNEALPLPILYAMENEEKRKEILTILKKRGVTEKGVKKLSTLISEAGGIDKLWNLFRDLKNQASQKIKNLAYNKALKTVLVATVPQVLK
jgi:geranylgeranyl pyrophosphate synthase